MEWVWAWNMIRIRKTEYKELLRKADLWDQYAIYDNDIEPEILVKDLITAYEKLEAVKTWFNELPVSTVSHLCTVLVPFEDGTVSQERTLYTVLKEILGVEE